MRTSKVLIVDDEPANRNTIMRLFDEYDMEFMEAADGDSGLALCEDQNPDLILLDILMPGKNGFQFLEEYNDGKRSHKAPVCVMTGMGDSKTRKQAVHLGADDFITKPFDPVELETRVTSLLRISNYQRDLAAINRDLENMVAIRTNKLQQALTELEESKRRNVRAYREMINRICALNSRTSDMRKANNLALCAATVAWTLGQPSDATENITLAAQICDIGMLTLPERLRGHPPEAIDEQDKAQYFEHTNAGANLFANTEIPLLRIAHDICAYHHEHFDGTGLPNGLKGNEIPEEARIFSIADSIIRQITPGEDSLKNFESVRQMLLKQSGHQLDPTMVDTIVTTEDTLKNIITQCE